MLSSSLFIGFIVILLKKKTQETILPDISIYKVDKQKKKKIKKKKNNNKNKKNFRPTDPNSFRHVNGNTGIFYALDIDTRLL